MNISAVRRDFNGSQRTGYTHYVGSVEVHTPASGGRQFRRMIGSAALVTWYETTDSTEVRYLHKDHLGSITAITDAAGQLVTRMSYDPWGKRRADNAWQPWQAPTMQLATMLAITPRGFTGHEHIDTLGIVHMNGRIYDANLGRFLQADPFVEDGTTLNRYTYVHNNPLAYTDPSGYMSFGQILRIVVAIVITYYTGIQVAALYNAGNIAGAAALAAVGGAVAGAVQTGTAEGAAWGAFSGLVFFGVGVGLEKAGFGISSQGSTALATRTVSYGFAGGTVSHLQGGKFGHGFVSSAGATAVAPFIRPNSFSGFAAQTVVGGSLSRISGGEVCKWGGYGGV